MPDDWEADETRRAKAALISTDVPNAARVADFLYGGQNNFDADRRAARALASAAPAVVDLAPAGRAFQRRVLRFLVAEAGVRQFLDIGAGLPLEGNTHEVTQSLVPECRIVYVDSDPMVLAHARALMKSAPGGAVGYVDADVRDPAAVVAGAGKTLDFSRPVAVLLLFTLAYVADAAAATSALMAAVPSCSYLVLFHPATDVNPDLDAEMVEMVRQWNAMLPAQPITLRTRGEVAGLAAGLDLVAPGTVPVTAWRPAPGDPRFESEVPLYGFVASKP